MAQSEKSALLEAFQDLIRDLPKKNMKEHSSENRIQSRFPGVSPRDLDQALVLWMENPTLLKTTESEEGARFIGSLGRFARMYSYARDKNRLGLDREDPDHCFERISDSRRLSPIEWLGFVPLFRNGRLGDLSIISEGTRSQVTISFQDLFHALLSLRPEGFYLIHNHPSGDLVPSREDRILTFEVQSLAHDLKLKFLGHGIVSHQGNHWIVI